MDIRPSPIAGSWYAEEAAILKREVDSYLQSGPRTAPYDPILGLVAPHAGHSYSGAVAGAAFGLLRGVEVDLVALVGPYHSTHSARLLRTAHDAYETPLGRIEVDQPCLQDLDLRLTARLGSGLVAIRRDREHSLEIELPFLQRVLSQFKLLPVMMVDQSVEVAQALGETLAQVLAGRRAVLVASSDLSHFYPQAVAEQLDGELLRRVESLDPAGVINAEGEGVGYACGCGAIAAVLWAARASGANRASVIRYATSGDVTGERESVVGYAAVAIGSEGHPVPRISAA